MLLVVMLLVVMPLVVMPLLVMLLVVMLSLVILSGWVTTIGVYLCSCAVFWRRRGQWRGPDRKVCPPAAQTTSLQVYRDAVITNRDI